MYIIKRGLVAQLGKIMSHHSSPVFGEDVVLFKYRLPRPYSAHALTFVEVFCVGYEAVVGAMGHDGTEFRRSMDKWARRLLMCRLVILASRNPEVLLAARSAALEPLMQRVYASRALRRLLCDRIRVCTLSSAMLEVAAKAEKLWQQTYIDDHLDESGSEKAEYSDHFAAHGHSRSGLEMSAECAAALLAIVGLTANDRFIDLGSSEGRLPLAAALLTAVQSAVGIELSASRHELAIAAQKRLHDLGLEDGASRMRPCLGDFLDDVVLSAALSHGVSQRDVIWCAVTARQGKRIAARLLEAVQRQRRLAGADAGGPTRLLLAGFALPDNSVGVTLHAGYVLVREAADAAEGGGVQLDDIRRAIPLIGAGAADSPGPRMLLEYHVSNEGDVDVCAV